MDFKLLGGILLIVGTSIGAGMLALPIATSYLGFTGSLTLFLGCWFVMTSAAFLLLEVNLWLPKNSNLISMAKATIGPSGQVIAWVTYLLLLYSLLCAYIAGGSDLMHSLLLRKGIELSSWTSSFLFTFLFGLVVYLGIRSVDYVNRWLMIIKLSALFLLVALLTPVVSPDNLMTGEMNKITDVTALTVTLTSFGYAVIVPSLRVYFNSDIKKLRLAILIGSLIPLVCYIAWNAVIMGIIPLEGDAGLQSILKSDHSTSDLVSTLSSLVSASTVTFIVKVFTSICVITSFLGVSLSLADFLADGFRMEKKGAKGIFIHVATFLPPLIIVLISPGIFVTALKYAGIYCAILLILMPAWMAWAGRYHRNRSGDYQMIGGRPLLGFLMGFGAILIMRTIMTI